MRFEDKSGKVKKELQKTVEKSLTKAGLIIKSDASLLVPINTGHLKGSIRKAVKLDDEETKVYVGTNVEYAYYVEFGTGEFAEKGNGRKGGWLYKTPDGEVHFTHGQKPKSFIRRAFRNRKQEVVEMLKKELGGAFK